MPKGYHQNTITKNLGNMTQPERSYSATASPGYLNETEAQEDDLKSTLIKMTETFIQDMSKSLEEIQQNTFKQVEALKEE